MTACLGKPFNPYLIINNGVSNIICSVVFGHRFEYTDEKFKKLMKYFEKGSQLEASIWAQVISMPLAKLHVLCFSCMYDTLLS